MARNGRNSEVIVACPVVVGWRHKQHGRRHPPPHPHQHNMIIHFSMQRCPVGCTAIVSEIHFHIESYYTRTHTHTHTYTYIHIHTYTHIYTHVYAINYKLYISHSRSQTSAELRIHIPTHTYTHTHIRTHHSSCLAYLAKDQTLSMIYRIKLSSGKTR